MLGGDMKIEEFLSKAPDPPAQKTICNAVEELKALNAAPPADALQRSAAMAPFMFSGAICCYNACDFEDIKIGCKGEEEFLCCLLSGCLAAGEEKKPVGMLPVSGAEKIKLGLPCCTAGIKVPSVLIAGSSHCLCMKGAASFPFGGPVPGPVCGICAFQIMPDMGFMKPPPAGSVAQQVMGNTIGK